MLGAQKHGYSSKPLMPWKEEQAMQNKHSKFFYPDQLENRANTGKIYYLPLNYRPEPEPEPEPKPDWSEKVLQLLEKSEIYAMGLVATLLATAIVRILGQYLWGW
jgi:hypothetical protein